jgi:N-acetylglucosamine kinase-like BadF-type ATPase
VEKKVEKEYLLTVDSGGSKTEIVLYDGSGELVKRGIFRGFGDATDADQILPEFSQALSDICEGRAPFRVACNLGGKNKRQLERTVGSVFPSSRIRVFRESEGVIAKVLCAKFDAQMNLMVGTGSIAVAPTDRGVVISGGWGANISDKGSGYQLGLDAVRLSLEELDGMDELSLLTKTLTGMDVPLGVVSAEEYCALRDRVRARLFPFDRANLAKLAKTVYACAKMGDAKAIGLYEKMGRDLSQIVLCASLKTGRELKRAVVTGGLVNAKEFWQESFERRVKSRYENFTALYLPDGLNVGLLEFAKNM